MKATLCNASTVLQTFAKKVSWNPNSNHLRLILFENKVRFRDTRLVSSSIPQTELTSDTFTLKFQSQWKLRVAAAGIQNGRRNVSPKIMQRTQLSFGYCFQRTAHVSSYRLEIVKTINVILQSLHRLQIHVKTPSSWDNLKTCARPVTGDECSHMSHIGQSKARIVGHPEVRHFQPSTFVFAGFHFFCMVWPLVWRSWMSLFSQV